MNHAHGVHVRIHWMPKVTKHMDTPNDQSIIEALRTELEELKRRVAGLEAILSDDHQRLEQLRQEHEHDHEALEKIEHEHVHDHTVIERLDHSYYTGRKTIPVGL